MNIAIVGYGKMGHEIEKILVSRGHNIGLVIDQDNANDLNTSNLSGIDVAIEFTTPTTAYGNIARCIEAGVPVVCGTTAWLERLGDITKLCAEKNGAFFYASNFSVGVNIMFKMNETLARLMNPYKEYDVTVEEVHHTQKKDAPSGTAITIADAILANMDRKTTWAEGAITEPSELGIASIRRSVVPGIHTVTYESEDDLITLCHNAKSRRGLALGAVLAAEFIFGKKGIYSMSDLLGF